MRVMVCVLGLFIAGCASIEPPLKSEPDQEFTYVDIERVDPEQYRKDYAACANIANQVRNNNDQMISGAMNTALDRASFGILGSNRSKDGDRQSVLKRCLTGRGYNVLR
ncbi:MAG: hypothetical protein RIR70_2214 [Pseudomonadota bacterium]